MGEMMNWMQRDFSAAWEVRSVRHGGHRGSSHPSLPRLAFLICWLGDVCLSQIQI